MSVLLLHFFFSKLYYIKELNCPAGDFVNIFLIEFLKDWYSKFSGNLKMCFI